ncbi:transcription factor SPEECHLESS [Rhododendron vialii]|uniref:transcription factor SPEECHLESS n=1 Tax=Rhododendron vialii TaxID=182163 RepID=UPI00265DA7C5|nr:transcription factor SPEECHLESS [Rhododendron vialii]
MGVSDSLSDHFFEESELEDIFSILENLEHVEEFPPLDPENGMGSKESRTGGGLVSQKSTCSSAGNLQLEFEAEVELAAVNYLPKSNKRQKLSTAATSTDEEIPQGEGQLNKISHITVERNRRKQMNEHLTVLRSLMPCFYVKRGDQASIIGGVVDYINELQQVLQSLEAKKQRKVYSEVLSPRLIPSPRPSPLSPRKPPLSPRVPPNLPISPRTPQPSSPYMPRLMQHLSPLPSPCSSSSSAPSLVVVDNATTNELVANSKSAIADVEVKFSGPNLLLKTISPRIPGQATKIMSTIEELSLEILHVSISTIDETMLNSFTIKIGIECQLSAEELAHQIQQTFC